MKDPRLDLDDFIRSALERIDHDLAELDATRARFQRARDGLAALLPDPFAEFDAAGPAPAAPTAEDQAVSRSRPSQVRAARPLTANEQKVLAALADGPLPARDLAEPTGIKPWNLTAVLKSLQAYGAITKTGKYNSALYHLAPDPSTT